MGFVRWAVGYGVWGMVGQWSFSLNEANKFQGEVNPTSVLGRYT